MTWSTQLFQFVLCGHPTPHCWSSQKRELSLRIGLFRSCLRTLGTHYHSTLDPAVLWTPSNDTSRPIFSDSLNLMPPVPLYLRTLLRYTNAVIIIIIIIIIIISRPSLRDWDFMPGLISNLQMLQHSEFLTMWLCLCAGELHGPTLKKYCTSSSRFIVRNWLVCHCLHCLSVSWHVFALCVRVCVCVFVLYIT